MKLFTEAGESANIGVMMYRTAFHHEKSTDTFKLLFCVFFGILLGEYVGMQCGIKVPVLLFGIVKTIVLAIQVILLFRRIFRKQRVLLAFTSKEKAGSFLVSPCQILWASPMGDVPLFDERGYKARQVEMADGVRFICIGKAGMAFHGEMQRLMPEERIWKCRKLVFEFGPQLEAHPEAKKVLEQKTDRFRKEREVCKRTVMNGEL